MIIKSAELNLVVINTSGEEEKVNISFSDLERKNYEIEGSLEAESSFSEFSYIIQREITYHNEQNELLMDVDIDEDVDDFDYENFG